MPLYARLLGKGQGNFDPDRVSHGTIIKAIQAARTGDNWPTKFFALRDYVGCDASAIVSTSKPGFWERWKDDFLATRSVASGIILEAPFQGGVTFTQDEISVCFYDLVNKRLALLPIGWDHSTMSLSGMSCARLSGLFGWFGHMKAKNVRVDLGWGAAPCCGQQNAQQAIIDHLEHLGIARERIAIHSPCTNCAGRDTPSPDDDFHSLAVDGSGAGRNALVVWFGKV